jgi:hypothetical protein
VTDVQPWNRAVAAAQEVGRNVRGFDIAAASRIAAIRRGSGTMAICTVWLNREELYVPRRSRTCAHT